MKVRVKICVLGDHGTIRSCYDFVKQHENKQDLLDKMFLLPMCHESEFIISYKKSPTIIICQGCFFIFKIYIEIDVAYLPHIVTLALGTIFNMPVNFHHRSLISVDCVVFVRVIFCNIALDFF